MKLLAASLIILGGAPLAAREMTCSVYSGLSPSDLLETVRIQQDSAGLVSFETTETGPELSFLDQEWKLLFQTTTENDISGDRFSTVVVEAKDGDQVYVPVIWFIDWENAVVSLANTAADRDSPTFYDDYKCERVS